MNKISIFVEKLNVKNCVNSTENFVHYMYGLSGFAEKLNLQNFVNSTGNCVQYMYGMSGFAENCVHYICTKCLDLQKY